MLNWRVTPELLGPHVPAGTTLDTWQGAHYVSLVGFLFRDTRVLGVPIPFHRDFEEINLRFYVRRRVADEVRRGVCFLRELVPRRAIAWTARATYNEPYRAVPMWHRMVGKDAEPPTRVEYAWRDGSEWNRIVAEPTGPWRPLAAGSHEEFITEHYWGYTRQRNGDTIEYRVTHPAWRTRALSSHAIDGDLARTYGSVFQGIMAQAPESALIADGSAIAVHWPSRIESR